MNRIAAVEFMVMQYLRVSLRQQRLMPEAQQFLTYPPHVPRPQNLLEMLENDYSMAFMRMGTFIRLGTELETFLRAYYMERRGIRNIAQLNASLNAHERMVFQRLVPKRGQQGALAEPHLVSFFLTELKFDLRTVRCFQSIQEVFVHRHLFTHQGGLADTKYLDDIEVVLGIAERQRVQTRILQVANVQLLEDAEVYWFEPLDSRFATLIEDSKRFVLALPQR